MPGSSLTRAILGIGRDHGAAPTTAARASPIARRTIHSAAVPESSVTIVGATGALGFGLALRLGRAGVPVVIGSRDAGRAQEAAGRARGGPPAASITGLENADAVTAVRARDPERPVSQPVREPDQPQGRAQGGSSCSSMRRSPSQRPSAGRRRGRSGYGRARRPSRPRRWSRLACARLRRFTPSAPRT